VGRFPSQRYARLLPTTSTTALASKVHGESNAALAMARHSARNVKRQDCHLYSQDFCGRSVNRETTRDGNREKPIAPRARPECRLEITPRSR